jgi:predicted outer membrane repeat protein
VIISRNRSGYGGFFAGEGGGIFCNDNSSLNIVNTTIIGNRTLASGGGIYCDNSNLNLTNVIISADTALLGSGGGIYCDSSNLNLADVTINGNVAQYYHGGGIYCWNSNSSLTNVTMSGNSAFQNGGGIYCDSSSVNLANVTISGNNARFGGGVYSDNPVLNFDTANQCNIFLNFAGSGCDLYAINCNNTVDVKVDTFTVLQPDDYFAYPIDMFTFDILNAKIEQVNQNLYVSPTGSDYNTGLTINDPLLTVSYALAKILADSSNPLKIHLSDGVYSPSQTGERFPLNCRSYVSLIGENEASTILDGEEISGILTCMHDNNFSIQDISIKNGRTSQGGGIYCDNSSPSLNNVTINENFAASLGVGEGGGIYCSFSGPILTNVTISKNAASSWLGGNGGGIYCNNSNPSLINVLVLENTAYGGINYHSSIPILTNVTKSGNGIISTWDGEGGGIYCINNSSPNLINATISGNSANRDGGGIYYENSNLDIMNCILWNDDPQEISGDSGSVVITYSDIQGGWAGTGNIIIDPLFADTLYHFLADSSLCIDAGNPDPIYNDPEDPQNLGYALWPAMGTLGNDMGAYGGPNAASWNIVVSIEYDETNELQTPTKFEIYQNYPNPFNPVTTIKYQIQELSFVTLKIYDVLGSEVTTLVNEEKSIGTYETTWYAENLPSGIYFYRIQAGSFVETKKMVLIK